MRTGKNFKTGLKFKNKYIETKKNAVQVGRFCKSYDILVIGMLSLSSPFFSIIVHIFREKYMTVILQSIN